MVDRGSSDRPRRTGSTRGFLFADLRGYTAFVERRGAAHAAALLDRYRDLVRTAVAEYDGAEIRTEGDSFYVVFPDASAAVACGHAVVQAALKASTDDPELQIDVGIGVHAGETVETAEGYVGSAVNIAARLCALAAPGEVLVSDTVRALTAGVAPVRFEQRGRRRLKGISEPIATYRAVPADQAASSRPSPSRISRRAAIGGLMAVALAAALMIWFAAPWRQGSLAEVPGNSGTSAPTGSADGITAIVVPTLDPEAGITPVALEPGPHRFTELEPSVTFDVPDGGWHAYRDYLDGAGLLAGDEAGGDDSSEEGLHVVGGLDFGRVQVVYAEPCRGADTRLLAPTPNALVEWLQAHEHLETSVAVPINLGGYSGLQVDVSAVSQTEDPCPSDEAGPQTVLFPIGEDTYFIEPNERMRVISLDVAGRPLTVMLWATRPVFDSFAERAAPLLDSLRITPG